MTIHAIRWRGDCSSGEVEMIDQRRLPVEEVFLTHNTAEEIAASIKSMVIRGAPAIGIAAAMGIVLGARQILQSTPPGDPTFIPQLSNFRKILAATRPTAVNLFWALDRMMVFAGEVTQTLPSEAVLPALHAEALAIHEEDIAMNRAMGLHGAAAMPQGGPLQILTHCNTGALATGGLGTALGVLRTCHEAGRDLHVWVDETRPYLQGARLTAWECMKENIPSTLITDSMAAFFMQQGQVDAVIIGADRIAANGDAANKIGSYGLAVLCKHHGIPFYVAAPTSTLDQSTPSGAEIPIEERSAEEVTSVCGVRIAPEGVVVRHPAFDVTPAELITAIITEKGVARAPFTPALAAMLQKS